MLTIENTLKLINDLKRPNQEFYVEDQWGRLYEVEDVRISDDMLIVDIDFVELKEVINDCS